MFTFVKNGGMDMEEVYMHKTGFISEDLVTLLRPFSCVCSVEVSVCQILSSRGDFRNKRI